jgi:hypothetical protein
LFIKLAATPTNWTAGSLPAHRRFGRCVSLCLVESATFDAAEATALQARLPAVQSTLSNLHRLTPRKPRVAGKDACGPVASAVVPIIVVDFNFLVWKT